MNKMQFIDYVYSFYGPNELYGQFFNHQLTKTTVKQAVDILAKDSSIPVFWDSFDRERVRDIMRALLGIV